MTNRQAQHITSTQLMLKTKQFLYNRSAIRSFNYLLRLIQEYSHTRAMVNDYKLSKVSLPSENLASTKNSTQQLQFVRPQCIKHVQNQGEQLFLDHTFS